ncbi:MAG TPA: hypothetical protein VKU94_05430 [Geobacterales bacterium]|nr:hypothetical protein [Geobacterales bacterium]
MDLREWIFIFLISFITNATPFFGAPYTIITSTIILRHGSTFNDLLEGIIVSALGATLAKNVMFGIGVVLRLPLKRNKNVSFFTRLVNRRSFFVGLLITAILPILPLDDFFFLIGGTSRASLFRMQAITFIAKLIKSGVEIPLEVFGIIVVARHIRFEPFYLGVISSVVFTILGILLFKIDVEKIYNRIMLYFRRLANKNNANFCS